MISKPGLFKRTNEPTALGPSTQPSVSSPVSPKLAPLPATQVHPVDLASAASGIQAARESNPDEAKMATASSSSRLIVGPEVKLKGAEILDCDTLIVEGRVEATMDSRVIEIAANGAFSGKVGIDVAEVHGRFDGELTARGQLIIHSTGRVSGKIRYGKILIEEGGELSGDVAALTQESAKINNLQIASSKSQVVS